MSRTLVSLAFIIDMDQDTYPDILAAIDAAVREHLADVLRKHGKTAEELGGVMEYYGAHLHPQWELPEYLGESAA